VYTKEDKPKKTTLRHIVKHLKITKKTLKVNHREMVVHLIQQKSNLNDRNNFRKESCRPQGNYTEFSCAEREDPLT
jgi:hypothetical protein